MYELIKVNWCSITHKDAWWLGYPSPKHNTRGINKRIWVIRLMMSYYRELPLIRTTRQRIRRFLLPSAVGFCALCPSSCSSVLYTHTYVFVAAYHSWCSKEQSLPQLVRISVVGCCRWGEPTKIENDEHGIEKKQRFGWEEGGDDLSELRLIWAVASGFRDGVLSYMRDEVVVLKVRQGCAVTSTVVCKRRRGSWATSHR